MSNEEYENPYEEHGEEISDYCYDCCYDELTGCVPDEMCPGCDCSDICAVYGDDEDAFNLGYYDEDYDYEWDEESDWNE